VHDIAASNLTYSEEKVDGSMMDFIMKNMVYTALTKKIVVASIVVGEDELRLTKGASATPASR